MVTRELNTKRVLLHLLRNISIPCTITLLASQLGLSRVGIWKILKQFEDDKYITLTAVGAGKTSAFLVNLNWENQLVEKTLSLFLTEEAIKQRRWQVNFADLEKVTDFVILYGSILTSAQQAHDIYILGITPIKNFVKIQQIIDSVQKTQPKKIHSLNFTQIEFKTELKKQNSALTDSIKKGVILFGQEKFVQFMKEIKK